MRPWRKNLPLLVPGYGVKNHSNEPMSIPEPDWYLREIDLHFGRFMQELSGGREEVFIAACLASKATGEGHVCLDLSEVAGKEQLFYIRSSQRYELIRCPELRLWCDILHNSKVAGKPGDYKPLILDEKGRLYLYRYWRYENILIEEILGRASRKADIQGEDSPILKRLLLGLFPYKKGNLDLQMISSLIPLIRYLCVITGGPGTGKTTTVAKILALLIAFCGKRKNRILLSAPTGKASARLKQAILEIRDSLNIDEDVKNEIPTETFTIHRLLRPVPKTPYFIHNRENRLSADVIVVDEASMVDLPLMSKLIQAIPEDARLIILGDKDQLSSVEPGSVLGDICAGSTGFPSDILRYFYEIIGGESINSIKDVDNNNPRKSPMDNCIVELKESYRFSEMSGIAKLSSAVNKGDIEGVSGILGEDIYPDIRFKKLPKPDLFKNWLREVVIKGYKAYLKTKDPLMAIKAFDSFRILCPIRGGPYGVRQINRLIEVILQEQGLISLNGPWYTGRPILITENSYELGLFNGDVGIIMPDPELNGEVRAFFMAQDREIRKFLPIRLPEHETVFAMTVHKSQGSEFDNVLFILPDTYVPVITRELIYTAITRAKNFIEIWGHMDIIERGIKQKIRRSSGLRDALWNV